MFIFMLILIPAVLAFSCFYSKDKTVVPVAVTGIVTGVFFCILSAIFSFMHRVPEYSFSSNFIYYLCKEYAVPMVVLYIAYFFITKDSIEFRTKAFFPLVAGFFSIYMPYCIIASSSARNTYSFFTVFVKPLLILSMLIILAWCVLVISSSAVEKKAGKAVLYSFLAAFALFFPPFIETLMLMKYFYFVLYVISVLYILAALVLYLMAVYREESFLL